MSDSWSFSPCCHTEEIEAVLYRCRHCSGFFAEPEQIYGNYDDLRKLGIWGLWTRKGRSWVNQCPLCHDGTSNGLRWVYSPYRAIAYKCKECGNSFPATRLIEEYWDGTEDYI